MTIFCKQGAPQPGFEQELRVTFIHSLMNMHRNLLNYADRKDVNVYVNFVLPSLLLWKPKNSKGGGSTPWGNQETLLCHLLFPFLLF